MYIDFSTLILDIYGNEIKDSADGKPFSLKKAAVMALLTDPEITKAADKAAAFQLACDIHASEKTLNVSVENIVKIKESVARVCTTLVTGRVYEIFDGAKAAKAVEG